jgi:hypothetical protein
LLGAAAWLAQSHVIPQLVKRTKPDEESLLLWLVAVLFVFVGIAFSLACRRSWGPFAGGSRFPRFRSTAWCAAQLSSLSDFFQACSLWRWEPWWAFRRRRTGGRPAVFRDRGVL